MSVPRRSSAALALLVPTVLVLAACGGGGTKKPAAASTVPTTTSTLPAPVVTFPTGSDQKGTPFCQTLSQLNVITDLAKDTTESDRLLTQGEAQAPPSLSKDFRALAEFLRAEINSTTTTVPTAAVVNTLSPSILAVGNYASGHCGIILNTTAG